MKKIDIIVLHFGDIKDTVNTVSSLEKFNRSYDQLIIVNNDPEIDLTKTELKGKSRVLINNKKNLGFAGGVNVGLKHAVVSNADYVVILNNDTYISSDFINPVIKIMEENKSIGIASPVIEFNDENIKKYDYGGKIIKWIGKTKHDNRSNISDKSIQNADYVSGCSMIISRKVIEKIGYFDEQFFLYYEDVDYCLRATSEKFKICTVPIVQIKHHLSKTIGKDTDSKLVNILKSGRKFSNKYKTMFPFMKLFLTWQSLLFLVKSTSNINAIMKGWRD